MSIQSKRELKVTRTKLSELEKLYDSTLAEEKNYAQDLTLRSLKRTMNQLKEEIVRFESKASPAASGK